jgi:hypothetical protein
MKIPMAWFDLVVTTTGDVTSIATTLLTYGDGVDGKVTYVAAGDTYDD